MTYNGEVFDNIYPQIVPSETFAIVRDKVNANKFGKRSETVTYLLVYVLVAVRYFTACKIAFTTAFAIAAPYLLRKFCRIVFSEKFTPNGEPRLIQLIYKVDINSIL